MLKITYEFQCDICRKTIREPRVYEIMPHIKAQNTALPQPDMDFAVGDLHVCFACLSLSRDALKAKIRAG